MHHTPTPPPLPSKVPYNIACRGYKQDPENENRFVHPDGHPYYPIVLDPERRNHDGDTVKAMLQAAFDAGEFNGYFKGHRAAATEAILGASKEKMVQLLRKATRTDLLVRGTQAELVEWQSQVNECLDLEGVPKPSSAVLGTLSPALGKDIELAKNDPTAISPAQ